MHALDILARLAWEGVPGCAGASVSLLHEGAPSTLAASHVCVPLLDEAQYRYDGPCVTAMRRREVVTVNDFATDPRWPELAAQLTQGGIHSSLSIPLHDGGSSVGGLNLYGTDPHAFTAASRQTAEIIACQAVLMLGFARRLDDERAAHTRAHEVAVTLQNALLPTLPRLAGITYAARYLASQSNAQVGGDWYDLFKLPDGTIGMAVGDVMGHDITAAATMGQLRSVLRSYAYEGSRSSVVLDHLDHFVQGFDIPQLTTVLYGRLILDNDPAILLFTNAGHLPPIVRHPDGAIHRLDRGLSPPIGVLQDPPPRNEVVATLPPGSLLLLYTDGLVETRERDPEAGIDQLCVALASTAPNASLEQVCEVLLSAMVGSDPEDDVALLALRIDPRNPATKA